MMVNGSGAYPYYEHYGGAPLFPTMSVNVSMNMTMHGCPPDQLCSQVITIYLAAHSYRHSVCRYRKIDRFF